VLDKRIDAADGKVGTVHDLYFDENTWTVRYIVVETGTWLSGRKVLVAPESIVKPWHHQPAIAVQLTTEQIRSSPDLDTSMPISRAAEELLHRHYQWTPYWDSTIGSSPATPTSSASTVKEDREDAGKTAKDLVDQRLRSANELAGYHVKAADGEVGQVEDLVLDDDLSRILFLVVEVKGVLFGKKVLAGPSLISRVDETDLTVHVDGNRQALKNAQEYNPSA